MKFVLLEVGRRVGLLQDDMVLDLGVAVAAFLERRALASDSVEVVQSLQSLIEAGPRGLGLVQDSAEDARGSDRPGLHLALAETTLSAPFPGQRLMMAGLNFADHVADYQTHMGSPLTPEAFRAKARAGDPGGFWSVARPIMGPGGKIEIPARARGYFDYEAEPAIVLGHAGKDLRPEALESYVWGVSLVADWTIREEWPGKASNGLMMRKNFDGSKSMGPCIVVDEGVDVGGLAVRTRVNGDLRQDFNSTDMIFSFAEMLEFVSRDFTVFPGDVISGGTGKGTVIDTIMPEADGRLPTEKFLQPGDIVEMESPQVGVLRSEIVEKAR